MPIVSKVSAYVEFILLLSLSMCSLRTENLDSDENLDLNDDFEIVCGQQPRDEVKMAEDGIKRMTELNKRRYPLLTMKTSIC
jgi:hypothetical protein